LVYSVEFMDAIDRYFRMRVLAIGPIRRGMNKIIDFPGSCKNDSGFQRVQSAYSAREISRQFGLSEHLIRKWTKQGLIPTAPGSKASEVRYDFHALQQFRRVRELRVRGLPLRRIEAELHGQLNLFPETQGQLIPLPIKASPIEKAMRYHESGDRKAAEFAYRQAIEEGDSIPDAYCNLGILDFEAGRSPEAFDHFTNALKHDPRHFESHFNLAHLYFEAGDLRLSRLHYELAAQLEPSFPNLYFNVGLVNAVVGDYSEAVTALNKARSLATDEDRPKIDELLANIHKATDSES
jgi:tetratricopeptide (TPR) repeat protein